MERRRGSTPFLALVVSLVLLAGGCGSSSTAKKSAGEGAAGSTTSVTSVTTTTTTLAEPATPDAVKQTEETFVDDSRPTAAGKHTPAATTRALVTTIVYPDVTGRSPLIVLSHGSGGSPQSLTKMATAWAQAGFVVALPRFPLTNSVNGGANAIDVTNQPGDVSFVISRLLAESDAAGSPMSGRVDRDHIGVAGHSLGGATAYGVAYAPCCRDDRIKAVVIFSGVRLIDSGKETFDRPMPTLVFHGTGDRTLPYSLDADAYALLHAPKWFVTLTGAPHSPPYDNEPSRWDDLVERSTTDFWQAELRGDHAKLADLAKDAVVDTLSTLQSDPG